MPCYNLGISPLGSCGPLISYFGDLGLCHVILWEQWGLHGAALLSGPRCCLISQVCVVAKQETALGSRHSSFFQFWNLVLVQEGLSTGLTG